LKSIAKGLSEKVQQKLRRIWQGREIGKLGAVLLGIPAACLALVLLGVTDVRQKEQQIESDIRSIERRVKLGEQVLGYVIDQETGVRGYLLTQDKEFLQPYHAAKKDLFPELAALKQQAADQKEILQRLEDLIMLRLQQAQGLLEFAEAIDLPAKSSRFSSSKGVLSETEAAELLQQLQQAKQTTDAIRQTIDTFKQQQQQILLQKNEQLKRSKRFVDQVQLLGALLSVLSYVGVVGLFQLLDRRMTKLTKALSEKALEQGKLNQQLFRINILLQRKNQSLETFVKAAAHDLKTPIRGIASLAQWLETDLSGSLTLESQTSLRLLNQRVFRMQAIADGLLSYANIETWIDQQATVDTRAMVEEICRQIPLPEAFSLRILGAMPTLRTPHLALKLVFEHLIRNAMGHHDRDRGIIEIIATPQKHCTQFVVRDDGPGIAPVYRDRVLQMFQVIDQNPDVSENIGVGLALVYRAVQLAGGTLNLKSASTDYSKGNPIERGLEVSFTWPFVDLMITG
jgi:signal transduction histidine kinase